MAKFPFNVRVYGIYIHENKYLLVSDEKYNETYFTKFIGGGLEFGEGTKECLVREFMEEHHLPIEVVDHFYTTDFFVPSTFNNQEQVISIYYFIKPLQTLEAPIAATSFFLQSADQQWQQWRYLPLESINEESVTFPIDKKVLQLLKKYVIK